MSTVRVRGRETTPLSSVAWRLRGQCWPASDWARSGSCWSASVCPPAEISTRSKAVCRRPNWSWTSPSQSWASQRTLRLREDILYWRDVSCLVWCPVWCPLHSVLAHHSRLLISTNQYCFSSDSFYSYKKNPFFANKGFPLNSPSKIKTAFKPTPKRTKYH